jgi:beta-N-acetylhexosaminidase
MKNVVFGISGIKLTTEEYAFFNEVKPVGFIIFSRNIDNLDQLELLIQSLRDLSQSYNHDPLILIDQEGGRVARLRPPHFMETPPAEYFGNLANHDFELAEQAVTANFTVIAKKLRELGINANCAPVADLFFSEAHEIIGDRSFGSNVDVVSQLALLVAEVFINQQILPIVKHIPGHGRAKADSHKALPIIETPLNELEKTDFAVFHKLNKMPMAMTAHVIYSALDPELPVTISPKAINYIRAKIGFRGLIISDDLSMQALSGSHMQRAKQANAAGCDLLLHCNGNMQEMQEVASGAVSISPALAAKIKSLPCYI